jgi:hypothetical protein
LLSGSTGISYNSTTGAISYSGTVYTDSSVRALISLTTTGTSGASTYNNTTGVINVPNYTLAGLGGISLTSLSGGTGITYNNTTGAISYSGTVYTDASVRALISASGAVSYNNTTGVISLTSGNLTEATSSVLTITGGTGAVLGSGTSIQVKQATTSVSGFLSSTDWNTFNGKANALSGTTNYVPKFTSGSAIGNSLIFDSGSNIGINTASPSTFTNYLNISLQGGTAGVNLDFKNTAGTRQGNIVLESGVSFEIGTPPAIPLIFRTNDVERLRISATGNVGIGNTNPGSYSAPASQLVVGTTSGNNGITIVGGTTGFSNLYLADGTTGNEAYRGYIEYGHSADYMAFGTAASERMRITSAGQIILGDTSIAYTNAQGYNLGIKSASTSQTFLSIARSGQTLGSQGINIGLDSGQAYFFVNDNIDTVFRNNAVESLRIFANRNIAIGTTTDNGYKLYVSGTIYATGNITANSDLTLKKNLTIIDNPTDKLMQLNGYSYQWKKDDSHQYGVIAQEVEKILPYAVSTGNDGIKGVSYNQIIPVLIEAVKEQKKELEELRDILASK